ncbi:MAG: nucleoside deaminase [Propionibacteriaceae bacterium]|nr:nucleoside deaminase [Propionibacteriaceae bacterium]
MGLALAEARVALDHGDVPIGAVVLDAAGVAVASAHNERELTGDPTAHAEVLALRRAAEALHTWRLDDCTLVATLEPCTMCAGALVQARVGRLVFGAYDEKAGAEEEGRRHAEFGQAGRHVGEEIRPDQERRRGAERQPGDEEQAPAEIGPVSGDDAAEDVGHAADAAIHDPKQRNAEADHGAADCRGYGGESEHGKLRMNASKVSPTGMACNASDVASDRTPQFGAVAPLPAAG